MLLLAPVLTFFGKKEALGDQWFSTRCFGISKSCLCTFPLVESYVHRLYSQHGEFGEIEPVNPTLFDSLIFPDLE